MSYLRRAVIVNKTDGAGRYVHAMEIETLTGSSGGKKKTHTYCCEHITPCPADITPLQTSLLSFIVSDKRPPQADKYCMNVLRKSVKKYTSGNDKNRLVLVQAPTGYFLGNVIFP